jgi:gluconokinase
MPTTVSPRITGPGPSIVVMGVSASGKTSAGEALARLLGLDFVDGDDLHPAANVAKMSHGQPLTDEDREPWLDRIGVELADHAAHPAGLVVACSALRRVYRDRIRSAAGLGLLFVFLDISKEEASRRIAARKHHFMPPSLIESQFATLERPAGEPDVITISNLIDPSSTARAAADAIVGQRVP